MPELPAFDVKAATPHERLAFLADALDLESAWRDRLMAWDYSKILGSNSCGSVGCALGLAFILWPDNAGMEYLGPRGWVRDNDIVEQFFGITRYDMLDLFYTCVRNRNYQPRDIAARIRAYLRPRSFYEETLRA